MSRELTRTESIERSIIKKYRSSCFQITPPVMPPSSSNQ